MALDMNAVAIPTNRPGEVYLPALGRTFQQIELRDHWLRFPHLEWNEHKNRSAPPIAHKLDEGSGVPTYFQRLLSGDEMAWFEVLYFAEDRTDNDDITVALNRRELHFPKPVLRHAMEPLPLVTSLMNTIDDLRTQLDTTQRKLVVLDKTFERGTVDESVKKLVSDLRVGLPDTAPPISSAMKNNGFRLTPAQQIKDDDDIKVRNLKSGLLFLGGIAKAPLSR